MLLAHLRSRRLARQIASRLVALHGPAAHALARVRAIDASETAQEWFAWRIVHHVERQLGVQFEPSNLRRAELER